MKKAGRTQQLPLGGETTTGQEPPPSPEPAGPAAVEGLPIHWINGEPMVYDLDLAGALRSARPRSIRQAIKRLLEQGQVSPNGVRHTPWQTSEALPGRPPVFSAAAAESPSWGSWPRLLRAL